MWRGAGELYIPSKLGYGDAGAGGDIPGGAALVFTMEIKKVHGKKTGKDFKRFEPIPEDRKKKKKETPAPAADGDSEAKPKDEV